jgi:hypothetical protein
LSAGVRYVPIGSTLATRDGTVDVPPEVKSTWRAYARPLVF